VSIHYESAPDRPNEHFVMLGNELVSNAGPYKLPGLAMALHHYLLRLPPGWSTTIDQIAADVFVRDSRESLRRANRELMNAGYVVLKTTRDGTGRFVKRYQVFHNPQPLEARTPSKGRVSPKFPQVAPDAGKPAAGLPAAGKPAAGFPADKDKTDTEDCKKKTGGEKSRRGEAAPGPEAMVSRRAHASGASDRVLTSQDKIDGTRFAIAAVYGESWNKSISDEEAAALFDLKAPRNGRVTSVTAYMTKIFGDTPAFDTLLSQLDTELDGDSDDYDRAGEERRFPVCQRCAGFRYAIGASGVCAACDAELWSAKPGPEGWNVSILEAVITSLAVATGKTVGDEWAARVADHILSGRDFKRAGAGAKVKYVTETIVNDKNPARFLPTPTPARVA